MISPEFYCAGICIFRMCCHEVHLFMKTFDPSFLLKMAAIQRPGIKLLCAFLVSFQRSRQLRSETLATQAARGWDLLRDLHGADVPSVKEKKTNGWKFWK